MKIPSFILGVLASLVAAFAFPAVMHFASSVLVRLFGWLPIRGQIELAGKWNSVWSVESSRYPPQVNNELTSVRQLGSHVYIQFSAEGTKYIAEGLIDSGRYVTGTWSDRVQGGYHGAFQLVIDPKTRNMTGLWMGYSTAGEVKQGQWRWTRITPSQQANPLQSGK